LSLTQLRLSLEGAQVKLKRERWEGPAASAAAVAAPDRPSPVSSLGSARCAALAAAFSASSDLPAALAAFIATRSSRMTSTTSTAAATDAHPVTLMHADSEDPVNSMPPTVGPTMNANVHAASRHAARQSQGAGRGE